MFSEVRESENWLEMVLISLWHEKIKEIQDVLTTNLNFMKDIDYSDLLRINMLNTSIRNRL